MALTPNQEARMVALREMTEYLSPVVHGAMGSVQFSHKSNKYMDHSKKLRIDREAERILWQLQSRFHKLEQKMMEP